MRANQLESISFDELRKLLGNDVVRRALELEREYAVPPHLGTSGAIRAEVVLGSGRSSTRHSIEVTVYSGYGIAVTCQQCSRWRGSCLAAYACAVDLALSRPLRAAVLGTGSVTQALQDLGTRRRSRAVELAAADAAFGWIPPAAAPQAVEYLIAAKREEPGGSYYAQPGFDPRRPRLELRARRTGTNSLIGRNDPYTKTLAIGDRRILDLCVPARNGRKTWLCSGLNASIVLHLLRDRRLFDYEGRSPVRFREEAMFLRIAAAELLPSEMEPPADRDVDFFDSLYDRASPVPERVPALQGRWSLEDGSVDYPAREAVFFSGPYPFVWLGGFASFFPVAEGVDQDAAWMLHVRPAVALPAGHEAYVLAALGRSLRGRGVTLPTREAVGAAPAETPQLTLYVDGTSLELRARLVAEYSTGEVELKPEAPGTTSVDDTRRDDQAEASAIALVLGAGLSYHAAEGTFVASGEQAVAFWGNGVKSLRDSEQPALRLLIPDKLANTRVRTNIRAHVSLGLLRQELDAAVRIESEGVEAELQELRQALLEKRRWVVLRDGTLAKLADATQELVEDVLEVMGSEPEMRLAAHQLGRVERWVELSDEAQVDKAVGTLRTKLRALAVSARPEMPRGLRAKLRPYQEQGLAWLQFLDALGAGGILADDMGLGKTLMALAAIAWRAKRDGTVPSLVVCPTSVMHNWIAEAERFTPGLRSMQLYGAGRDAGMAQLQDADLVVTTYALLRRDVESLRNIEFRYVVLDEAQNIKNADAATTRAARTLRAERRLALTGTPVENNLMEFWSLIDFCNPGILSNRSHFDKTYARPVTAEPTGPQAARLRRIVRPFVLRRTKAQVLTELPPKQEIDLHCTLTTKQRRSYDLLAAVLREQVEQQLREQGLSKTRINALTALLRLRQIAVDPRLIDRKQPASTSAKRQAFLQLVRELRDEGRRALVFSQFVELLTLWRADLDAESISYQYLDGSTRDRQAVVARFQKGKDPLFLISLKAGGSGLNLTAADTVIHCDPWWNPAVEDQATDRTHRIGQTRSVTVYRLIAKGTVEEKIQKLKQAKREIAQSVLSEHSAALQGLTEEDIRMLLGASDGEDVLDDDEAQSVRPPAMERVGRDQVLEAARVIRSYLARNRATQRAVAEAVGASQAQISLLLNARQGSLPYATYERIMQLGRDG